MTSNQPPEDERPGGGLRIVDRVLRILPWRKTHQDSLPILSHDSASPGPEQLDQAPPAIAAETPYNVGSSGNLNLQRGSGGSTRVRVTGLEGPGELDFEAERV